MKTIRIGFMWLVFLAFGCGDQGENDLGPTGTVSGKVLFNDTPLSGGTVVFKVGNKRPVFASIGKDGSYEIISPVGTAKIAVQPPDEDDPANLAAGTKPTIDIPDLYRNVNKTLITFEVKESSQNYDIKVTK